MERRDIVTYDNGVQQRSLAPLLPRLALAWEYAVLAACADPEDPGRTHVLVQTQPHDNTPEYVVYRVDGSNGSCHGGSYVGADLTRALVVFTERLALVTNAANQRAANALERVA